MKPASILCALLLAAPAIASAQGTDGYVNIGEYTDDLFTTAPAQAPVATVPIDSYEIITQPVPQTIMEPVAIVPDAYAAPLIYSDPQIAPMQIMPMQVAPMRVAPMQIAPLQAAPLTYATPALSASGPANGDYETARLAAYDTNRDGTVTTAEAIATMGPLAGR